MDDADKATPHGGSTVWLDANVATMTPAGEPYGLIADAAIVVKDGRIVHVGAASPAEIAAIMDFRAKRAIDHMTALAWGQTPRTCPICAYEGMFSPVRHKPEIWCPSCDSRPRHRLLKLWMDREMALAPGAKVLHFAAEPWVRGWLKDRGAEYVTADINDLFELQLDLTAMDLPDAS